MIIQIRFLQNLLRESNKSWFTKSLGASEKKLLYPWANIFDEELDTSWVYYCLRKSTSLGFSQKWIKAYSGWNLDPAFCCIVWLKAVTICTKLDLHPKAMLQLQYKQISVISFSEDDYISGWHDHWRTYWNLTTIWPNFNSRFTQTRKFCNYLCYFKSRFKLIMAYPLTSYKYWLHLHKLGWRNVNSYKWSSPWKKNCLW